MGNNLTISHLPMRKEMRLSVLAAFWSFVTLSLSVAISPALGALMVRPCFALVTVTSAS